MKKVWLLILIAFVLSMSGLSSNVSAQPSHDYMVDSLNVIVDNTMKGYNLENYVDFYRYFADKMESAVAKQYFKAVYVDVYKKNLGYLEAKKLLSEESSFDPGFPIMVYECQFEKYKDVIMIVNFIKEEGAYRITQLTIDKVLEY